MRGRKRWAVFILMMLCFIWGNSAMSPEISNAISDKLTLLLGGEILSAGAEPEGWLTTFLVRKAAHFSEFALLGAFTTCFCWVRGWLKREQVAAVLLFGLLTALTDETIQLWNGRTSSVKDVWLDGFGFAAGCCLIYLVFRHMRRKQSCKKTCG